MMNPERTERRIAIFLDFENLVTNTGITAASFDLQPALDRLLEKGKVIFRRAYCDWSRFKEAKRHLHDLGVELVDVPPTATSGKNGADMRLVIDALELCHARDYIDTFVIGSGDSDFCPLAYKLRENDRRVIGIGVKEATSKLFVKACDEFMYLKLRTVEEAGAEERRGKQPRKQRSAAGQKPAAAGRKPKGEVPAIAREVVSSLLAQATEPINPSLIKETIVRKQPDFDEREYGFSTFSKLLDALEKEGLLRRQQYKGRQLHVVAPDTVEHTSAGDREDTEANEKSRALSSRDPGEDEETLS
jgi:uncharacterized LabA/DUF88 family protein